MNSECLHASPTRAYYTDCGRRSSYPIHQRATSHMNWQRNKSGGEILLSWWCCEATGVSRAGKAAPVPLQHTVYVTLPWATGAATSLWHKCTQAEERRYGYIDLRWCSDQLPPSPCVYIAVTNTARRRHYEYCIDYL